jgi:hypothetical protein
VAAMMAVMHEDVHQRTCKDQEIRQHAEDMCGMLRHQKEPRHNKKTAGHNLYRRPPPRLFMLFVVHGIRSVRYAAAEEIVQGRKHCGDIPTPRKAFDEAKKIALPTQKFEPRQKNRKRLMPHGEIRHQ